MTIAQRRIGGNRRFMFFRRDRLAGQQRFVDLQSARTQNAHVCGHPVTRLKEDDVARNQIRDIHRLARAIPQYRRMRSNQIADRAQRPLGLSFLNEADDRIGDHHRRDHGRVDDMAQQQRRARRCEQEIDKHAVELRQEPQRRMHRGGRRQAVRPECDQAAINLVPTKAGFVTRQ